MTIDAVVAQLTTKIIETINTGFVFLKTIAIVAILTKVCMHEDIAILEMVYTVHILGVFQ